jgi:hypothetical protein
VDVSDNVFTGGWKLQIATGTPQRWRFVGGSATSGSKRNESNASPVLNTWQHVIARESNHASVNSSSMDFMFNGMADAGNVGFSANGNNPAATGTPTRLAIGNIGSASFNAGAPGAIAHLAIWSYKIPDSIGLALFLGASPLDFPYGLVAYYALDGQEGFGYEPDRSGYGQPAFAGLASATPLWFSGPPRIGRRPLRRIAYKPPAGGTTFTATAGGSIGPAGTITRLAALVKTGGAAPAGTVSRAALLGRGGSVAPSASITRAPAKLAAGVTGPSGAPAKAAAKPAAGTIGSSGAISLLKVILRAVGGTIASSGAVLRQTAKGVAGTLAASGAVTRLSRRAIGGVIAPTGALAKSIGRVIVGVLGSVGLASLVTTVLGPIWARAIFVPDAVEATFAADAIATSVAPDPAETSFIPDLF